MRKSKKRRNDHILEALGDAIRNRRIELKLTQEEVGDQAELHRTYVTDIENGLRNISFLTLVRLVKVLKCPLSYILVETENLDGRDGDGWDGDGRDGDGRK